MKAFAGESQARNRYTYFASAAKKEGFVQISDIFAETAENIEAAGGGEHEEWTTLYPGFAAKAREEGFTAVATVFEKISIAEKTA